MTKMIDHMVIVGGTPVIVLRIMVRHRVRLIDGIFFGDAMGRNDVFNKKTG